jgi:hypothetical protein
MEIEEAHSKEYEDFTNGWDQKNNDKMENNAMVLQQLQDKHR